MLLYPKYSQRFNLSQIILSKKKVIKNVLKNYYVKYIFVFWIDSF